MNRNSKKMWPALAVSLVLATSFINAADNADMNRSKPNMDAQKQKGSMGMITPPVNPAVQGVDFSFGIEAIYMRVTEDSENVGIQGSAPTAYPTSFSVAEQQYDWTWGVRVDAGYAMGHDGWDLQAKWTWLKPSHTNDRSVGAPLGGSHGFFSPIAPVSPTNDPFVSVHSGALNSHRRLLMNTGDLDLGREFFISKWLVLRPCVGARGIWIKRDLTVEAINILAVPTGLSSRTTKISTHTSGSYSAGGIYVGLNTQWGFGDGWSLFGEFDQALVYGRNSVSSYEVDHTSTGNKYTRAAVSDKWNTVRGITDLAVGLRWDYLFDNDRYRLRIQGAWEEHLFSNLDVNNFGRNGDLAVTGASFKVGFDF